MPSDEQSAMQPILRDIHRYWFGPLAAPADRNPEKAEIWFKRSDETDAHIRETWGDAIAAAAAVAWDLDELSREEQVGLIVLLDQFPRNIYRTTGEAFAYDRKARAIADALLVDGLDRFYLVEQTFVCLPFEHSEAIADQDRALLHFAEMAVNAPEELAEAKRLGLDFATKHRDLIRKFGRFPHRNEMLGRESTEEEKAFLAEHGRGY
ncbi:DUF924 family protein [Bauldia litoralis]|uniref:Uncharacterized conserved protein, DUF924 family n=1 Tax=Bauldia litoralis TaxID=665467 RepID=A0A1G6E6Z1_9HYPH|nr:DUF924 family protein [Bauldia litoralis]SDB52715.1 Uncharacterized conserved protein, DUF924 family [Bauldia litoralis]